MEHAERAILAGRGDSDEGAREVVGIAHDSISEQGEQEGAVILGSSTICLGVMRPEGLLEMANVGDSGFRVVRGNETVFASEVQLVSCMQLPVLAVRRHVTMGSKLVHSQRWRWRLCSSLHLLYALLNLKYCIEA